MLFLRFTSLLLLPCGFLAEHVSPVAAAPRSGPFNLAVRELLGRYVALEEHYLDETAGMAIRIDEVVSRKRMGSGKGEKGGMGVGVGGTTLMKALA